MIEVGRQYIEEALNDMISLVGIKEDISSISLKNTFFREGGVKKCIKQIAEYLGLPIEVNVFDVSSSSYEGDNQFTSSQLTKTGDNGRSSEGITAQVIIPSYVPLFGSKELVGFPVSVKVSKNIGENPETFFAIMAHELFHVVMHSLRLIKKDNEIYTDIGVMLSGFNKIMKEGRDVVKEYRENYIVSEKIIRETIKYGYLSDSDFWFVNNKINQLLLEKREKKKAILRQIDYCQKQVVALKKYISGFRSYIEFLDKNLKRKINPTDAEKIVLFHQPNYFDEFEKTVKIAEKTLEDDRNFIEPIKHYHKNSFKNTEERLINIKSDIKERKRTIKKDMKICARNIGIFDRIKLYLKNVF